MSARIVRDFSKIGDAIAIPNLIEIQRASYSRFLQEDVPPTQRKDYGLESLFREIFPSRATTKRRSSNFCFTNWRSLVIHRRMQAVAVDLRLPAENYLQIKSQKRRRYRRAIDLPGRNSQDDRRRRIHY